MKHIFYTVLCIAFAYSTQAQERQLPKLSPLTQLYLHKLKNNNDGIVPGYIYKEDAAHNRYVSALVKVADGFEQQKLDQLGVKIGTKAGRIWTAQVPLGQVIAFTTVAGIEYIQLDEPVFPTLDSVRRATRVDSAQSGIGLSMPFNGSNVVVGIIDAGFDYSHPTLFDTTGTGFRVRKVWEEKTVGTPPSGFSYGNEMTDSVAMWTKGTDNGQTHAMHVAGIAAGSGFGSNAGNDRFRGVAYKADMVFVGITPDKNQWYSTGISDMVDGMSYIYNYAASVSKPAVVNLSWGTPVGPRDGSSLFSQACDNLTGAGKIFVCAAGNNGQDKIHVNKTFTTADTLVQTFLTIANTPVGKKTWLDIWGDTGKTFCLKVTLYNGLTQGNTTGFVCIDNTIHSLYIIGSNNDTCFVDITTSSSEFNHKPRIFAEIYNKTPDNVVLGVKGTNGTINMWNAFVYNTTGYYGSFDKNNLSWATNGTNDMTISDIAATKSAISVGAFASKVTFTNVNNATLGYTGYVNKGYLVPFSSRGPTQDGRIKPDITAPGLTVASSVSSYDTTFAPTGSDYIYVVSNYHKPQNNRDYAYGQLSGTSMASPAVAGIVAMMLQAKPALTPQDVRDVLVQTAIKDGYTGTIPAGGRNDWGNGKVNAYAAVKRAVQLAGISNIVYGTLDCDLYPNPNNGSFTIAYDGKKTETLRIEIYDMPGRLVSADVWPVSAGYNSRQYDLGKMSKGAYFAKVCSDSGYFVAKMIVE